MQFKVIVALVFATFAAAYPQNTPGTTHAGAATNAGATTNAGTNTNTEAAGGDISPPVSGSPPPTIPKNECPAAELQCCQSQLLPTDQIADGLLKALNINPDNVSGYVGVTCALLPATGACPAGQPKPLCCTNDNNNGGVVAGCIPVNLD